MGEAFVLNVEAAPVSTVVGAYMIADGMTRMLSAIVQISGAINKSSYLESWPSNLPGMGGFLMDNIGKSRSNLTSGGRYQTTFEILGDFGLSKVQLVKSVEKMLTSPTFLNRVDVIYNIVEPYVSPIIKIWEQKNK